MERPDVITFKGNPMTLIGPELKPGDVAPKFKVVNRSLEPVQLDDYKDQVVLISAVPSLDTAVCELQTKRFNEEAAKLNIKILTISMDLPFAARRFCESFQIGNIEVLSDYQERSFATAYGLLIKELALITRAVIVIGKNGSIAHIEIVPEVTNHPDYDEAIEVAKSLL